MIQKEIQKFMGDDFEANFSIHDQDVFEKLANAKYINNNPVCAIVFKRNELVENSVDCKIISRFGYSCTNKNDFVSINLIYNDQDIEAKNCAVGMVFANEGDWEQVFKILRDNQ